MSIEGAIDDITGIGWLFIVLTNNGLFMFRILSRVGECHNYEKIVIYQSASCIKSIITSEN